MTNTDRIGKLFGLLAIACLLTVKTGSMRALFKKIPIKNHGRAEFSVFTYGLDFLKGIFSHPYQRIKIPRESEFVLDKLFEWFLTKNCILGVKNVGY